MLGVMRQKAIDSSFAGHAFVMLCEAGKAKARYRIHPSMNCLCLKVLAEGRTVDGCEILHHLGWCTG